MREITQTMREIKCGKLCGKIGPDYAGKCLSKRPEFPALFAEFPALINLK